MLVLTPARVCYRTLCPVPPFRLVNARQLPAKVNAHMDGGLQYPLLLQDVLSCLYASNAYFSDQQPWTMLPRDGTQPQRLPARTSHQVALLLTHRPVPDSAAATPTHAGADGDPVGLNTVLYITAETLRVCALALHPIVRVQLQFD